MVNLQLEMQNIGKIKNHLIVNVIVGCVRIIQEDILDIL